MSSVTPDQKKVIDCILSIFETGRIPSPDSYKTCTILPDGAGISYGKHQATDAGGNLDKIVQLYIDKGGALGPKLLPFLSRLASNDTAKVDSKKIPVWANNLMSILKEAGGDSIMQASQDEIFDSAYWLPAVAHAQNAGLKTALGHLVIYDTCIHSGPGGVANIRAKFPEPSPSRGGDEKKWIYAYIAARREWLASSPKPIVQGTVYRMDSLKSIADSGNWDLVAPLKVRGVTIPKV
jgi:chitosanase